MVDSLDEIQEDADKWIEEYNKERTHSGRYCHGKTPWQPFLDSKSLAEEKMPDKLQPTVYGAVNELRSQLSDEVVATTN